MAEGHEANARGNINTALDKFCECYEKSSRLEARISAANMRLKLCSQSDGDDFLRDAIGEYQSMLRQIQEASSLPSESRNKLLLLVGRKYHISIMEAKKRRLLYLAKAKQIRQQDVVGTSVQKGLDVTSSLTHHLSDPTLDALHVKRAKRPSLAEKRDAASKIVLNMKKTISRRAARRPASAKALLDISQPNANDNPAVSIDPSLEHQAVAFEETATLQVEEGTLSIRVLRAVDVPDMDASGVPLADRLYAKLNMYPSVWLTLNNSQSPLFLRTTSLPRANALPNLLCVSDAAWHHLAVEYPSPPH